MEANYTELFSFKGKTVIVTGAASGLGREIALALADFGAALVIADIDGAGLKVVAAEIEARGRGGGVVTSRTDVSRPNEVDAMVAIAGGMAPGASTPWCIAPGSEVARPRPNTRWSSGTGS